jgi:hypothetical protein
MIGHPAHRSACSQMIRSSCGAATLIAESEEAVIRAVAEA